MAKSLFEALQQSQSPAPALPQLGAGQNLQNILAAKSGKALASPGTPAASALGAQAAASQTAQQAGQLAQQQGLELQNQQQAGQQQEQQFGLQQQGLEQQRQGTLSQSKQKGQQLLNEFQQAGKQLDYQKDAAKIEQLGTASRLSNDKYLTQLQQAGDKARLDDVMNFKTQLADSVFGDRSDMLKQNLDWSKILDQNNAGFAEEMGKMDIADAIDLLNSQMKQANSEQMFKGLGSLVSGGAQAWTVANQKSGGK